MVRQGKASLGRRGLLGLVVVSPDVAWQGRCGKVCQCTASRGMVVRVLARFGRFGEVRCVRAMFVVVSCGEAWQVRQGNKIKEDKKWNW